MKRIFLSLILLSIFTKRKEDTMVYKKVSVSFRSGFTRSFSANETPAKKLLSAIDILIDGPFIQAERSLELVFRGSRNQRILDVAKSLAEGKGHGGMETGDSGKRRIRSVCFIPFASEQLDFSTLYRQPSWRQKRIRSQSDDRRRNMDIPRHI